MPSSRDELGTKADKTEVGLLEAWWKIRNGKRGNLPPPLPCRNFDTARNTKDLQSHPSVSVEGKAMRWRYHATSWEPINVEKPWSRSQASAPKTRVLLVHEGRT